MSTLSFMDQALLAQSAPSGLPVLPLSGSLIWLRADDISGLSDTDPITTWPDVSGNGNDATGAGATRPLYRTNQINTTLPAVQFDGAGDFLDIPNIFGAETAAEIFVVVKLDADPTTGAAYGQWRVAGTGDNNAFPFTDGNVYEGFCSTVRKTVGNPTPSLASWRLYNVSSAASSWIARLDTSSIFSTGTNTFSSGASGAMGTARRIGQSGGTSVYLKGVIAEFIVFGSVLSAGDRIIIEDYLDAKYDLAY